VQRTKNINWNIVSHFEGVIRRPNGEPSMSALGQKQTSDVVFVMSALPPKADIAEQDQDVRFVPKADISWFTPHLVGAAGSLPRVERAAGALVCLTESLPNCNML